MIGGSPSCIQLCATTLSTIFQSEIAISTTLKAIYDVVLEFFMRKNHFGNLLSHSLPIECKVV